MLPDVIDRVDVTLWGVAAAFLSDDARWSDPGGATLLGVSKHGINKEFDVLIAALPRLQRRWHGVRVVLTGTPEESRWSRRSHAAGASSWASPTACISRATFRTRSCPSTSAARAC